MWSRSVRITFASPPYRLGAATFCNHDEEILAAAMHDLIGSRSIGQRRAWWPAEVQAVFAVFNLVSALASR
jgi:hypothetical protein